MNHVKKYTKRIKVANNYVPGKKKKRKTRERENRQRLRTFYFLFNSGKTLFGWVVETKNRLGGDGGGEGESGQDGSRNMHLVLTCIVFMACGLKRMPLTT